MIAALMLLGTEWTAPVIAAARRHGLKAFIPNDHDTYRVYGCHITVTGDDSGAADRFHADLDRIGVSGSVWWAGLPADVTLADLDYARTRHRFTIPTGPHGDTLERQLNGLHFYKALGPGSSS